MARATAEVEAVGMRAVAEGGLVQPLQYRLNGQRHAL